MAFLVAFDPRWQPGVTNEKVPKNCAEFMPMFVVLCSLIFFGKCVINLGTHQLDVRVPVSKQEVCF